MKYCPECQREYPDSQNFCEYDGKKLLAKKEKSASDKRVCPHCGKETSASARFCDFCGADLQKRSQGKKAPSSKFKQHYQKKKKIYQATIAIIILLIVGSAAAYLYGKSYYSKDKQMEQFETALKSADPQKLATVVDSGDKKFKPTADDLTPFTDYLKEHKEYADLLTKNLYQEDATNHDIYVKKAGKYFFLFDKYQLILQPVYFNVHTNVKGMQLAVNDQKKKTSDNENYYWKMGPLAPGQYDFKATYDNNGKEETLERKIAQVNRENIEHNKRNLSFSVTKVKFNMKTHVQTGELLLNGKSVGKIKDGKAEGISFVWRADEKIQLKQKIGKLELTSLPLEFDPEGFLEENYEGTEDYYNPKLFTIFPTTNEKTGEFYLNDEKVTDVRGDYGGEDIIYVVPTKEPYRLQLRQKLDDGTVLKSKVATFDPADYPDGEASERLNIEDDVDESKVGDFLLDLYTDVFDYTDEESDFGDSQYKHLAEYFSGGMQNADYIDFKDNFIIPTRKAKNKSFINADVADVENVTRTGQDTYDVQYVVHYKTYYKDDTPPVSQYFRYKKAAFVMENGKLKIRDLRGKDYFEEVPASHYE